MRIIAVDPGLVTGWAVWGAGPKPELQAETEGAEAFMDVLNSLLDVVGGGLVVIENFIPRPGVTWQPDALHITGYARGRAHQLGWRFQTQPTSIKKFSTNAKLKRLGWYTPTAGGHANDALRHLLHALCFIVRDDEIIRRAGA